MAKPPSAATGRDSARAATSRSKTVGKKAVAKKAVAKKVVAKQRVETPNGDEATAGSVTKAALVKRTSKKPPSKKKAPGLAIENELWAQGHDVIVGLDEVGRGSWAGPLAIGAAVLPRDGEGRIRGVRDSKMLSEREREGLFEKVAQWCRSWSIGMVSHDECDDIGMSAAQKLAARRALDGLGLVVDHVLVDGNWDFVGEYVGPEKVTRIIKGDATCLSIATASVLAKVSRDRLMRSEDEHFPGFNFAENKGYPCPKHKIALQAYGPTTIHRRSWVFMEHQPWSIPRTVPIGHQQPLF